MSAGKPARREDLVRPPAMMGIVALLDTQHEQQARFLQRAWRRASEDELDRIPHISLHVAESYADADGLREAVRGLAAGIAPMQVRCGGLGFFTSVAPVVYVPVVRAQPLSTLHRAVWDEAANRAFQPIEHYSPDSWLPHITLAEGELRSEQLAALMDTAQARGPQWNATLSELALMVREPEGHRIVWTAPLGG